jgi:transcriptional regulator with XRE-family HTH domain
MYYTPTPKEIKDARTSSNLTQEDCAKMCLLTTNTWSRYEQGKVQMPPPIWELFIMKVAQLSLTAKPKGKDANEPTAEEKKYVEDMMANWDKEALEREALNYGYRDGRPFE